MSNNRYIHSHHFTSFTRIWQYKTRQLLARLAKEKSKQFNCLVHAVFIWPVSNPWPPGYGNSIILKSLYLESFDANSMDDHKKKLIRDAALEVLETYNCIEVMKTYQNSVNLLIIQLTCKAVKYRNRMLKIIRKPLYISA